MDQFTGMNLINPYSKELMKSTALNPTSSASDGQGGQGTLSKYSKSYLKTVCQFERLYHMYMSSKNKKDVMIT